MDWLGPRSHVSLQSGRIYEWQINRIVLPDEGYGVVCYFRNISAQVQARQAVSEAAQRQKIATQAAELGIWQWYPDQDRPIWENDRVYEIFGRSREDGPISAAEFASKIVHPEDATSFQQSIRHAAETGSRFLFQGRARKSDGSPLWIELTGQIERNPDGSPLRMLGTVLDITERKNAEEMLRQAHDRLQTVIDSITDGLLVIDREWRYTFFSNTAAKIVGVASENLVGPVAWDVFPQTTRFFTEFRQAMETGDTRTFEEFYPDPINKWLECRCYPNEDGLTVYFHDVTDRRNAEERERQVTTEVIAANAKFRALFEQSNVFAGIMTKDGTLIDANRSSLEICGYRPEQVLGKPFWETAWWRDFPESQQKIRAATPLAALGIPYRETLHYSVSDGIDRLVDFALYPIVEGQGMSPRKLAEVQSGGSGVGIRGMHERLRQFKGKLNIQSDASGTRISATIPIPETTAEPENGSHPVKAVV